MEPVDRSTIWPYERGEPGEHYYSRYAHPTGTEAERRLGELEGGDALLYASGMGAETAIVLALARPGTTIALAEEHRGAPVRALRERDRRSRPREREHDRRLGAH